MPDDADEGSAGFLGQLEFVPHGWVLESLASAMVRLKECVLVALAATVMELKELREAGVISGEPFEAAVRVGAVARDVEAARGLVEEARAAVRAAEEEVAAYRQARPGPVSGRIPLTREMEQRFSAFFTDLHARVQVIVRRYEMLHRG